MSETKYDRDLAGRYDSGRALTMEMGAVWLAAARKYIPAGKELRIVDIGSGTGRFSELFADKLGAKVTGVEPSDDMRKIAESKNSAERIRYLKGSAESLPLSRERFDLAWISMTIHHVRDRKACAAETARVLEKQGIAMVRNAYKGRLDGIEFYGYFRGALEADNGRLPSIEEVREDFEGAGLEFVALESVEQAFADDFSAYTEKMRTRATSTLRLIPDEEFHAGIARMEEILKTGKRTGPITEIIDMLVFRKG